MPGDFHRWEFRRSKRRRLCNKCSKVIPKGQEYYSGVTREEGQFRTTALCIPCGALREEELENKPPIAPNNRFMTF